ncbi:MAG: hypothetical protein BAJALOKI3v1_1030004 [Promethearchaeota archaeon]|jgi:hypothetical protein|nr:MAG: hypothetical protein BAJALOKI3v1_1030004 [Candidatus Lokiarchaeota archaeon]
MGILKEVYDVIKDTCSGTIRKTQLRKLIENMILAIETDTVTDFFPLKFKKLERLILSINLNEMKYKDYFQKYLRIKRYYKTHLGNTPLK